MAVGVNWSLSFVRTVLFHSHHEIGAAVVINCGYEVIKVVVKSQYIIKIVTNNLEGIMYK